MSRMDYAEAERLSFPNAWISQRIHETSGSTRWLYRRWWFHRHYGLVWIMTPLGAALGAWVGAHLIG